MTFFRAIWRRNRVGLNIIGYLDRIIFFIFTKKNDFFKGIIKNE